MSDFKFLAALAPLAELVARVRRETDERIDRALTVLSSGLDDASQATREDFQLARSEHGLPPVEPGDSPQVSGSCKSSTPPQEAE